MVKKAILLICITFSSYSQNVETPNPTPSSTYDFTKFGDIGVNEYKGLADINLPIYNSSENPNINLSLNYYSGGIKVNEEAGIVGLGWSMTMPTIKQNIKSKPDFTNSGGGHLKILPFQGIVFLI